MAITRINQIESGLDKLLAQFKDKPNINNMTSSYLEQVQETQIAYEEMLDERSLTTSVGVQLDNIGAIVGEDRKFRNDLEYREAIFIRIALNSATGTLTNTISILQQIYPQAGSVDYYEHYPASLNMFIRQVLLPRDAYILNGTTEYWRLTQDISLESGESAITVHFDGYDTNNHGIELFSTEDPDNDTGIYIGKNGRMYIKNDDATNITNADVTPFLVDGYNEITIRGDFTTLGIKTVVINENIIAGGLDSSGSFDFFNIIGGYQGERSNPAHPTYDANRKTHYEGYFRYFLLKSPSEGNNLEYRFDAEDETSTQGSKGVHVNIANYEDTGWNEVNPDTTNVPDELLLTTVQSILPSGVRLGNIGYSTNTNIFTPYDAVNGGGNPVAGYLAERPDNEIFDLVDNELENILTHDGFTIDVNDTSAILSAYGRLAETI
jgi:hypothetical protein